MSNDPSLPITQMPNVLKATPVEEDIEKLQFRPVNRPKPAAVVSAGEARLLEPQARPEQSPRPDQPIRSEQPARSEQPVEQGSRDNRDYEADYMQIGNVMKAMFPDGFHPRTEGDFAIFHLFGRMVGNVTRFAHTGMRQADVIRDVSADAMKLEALLLQRSRR
jgi:hypothetical protein